LVWAQAKDPAASTRIIVKAAAAWASFIMTFSYWDIR
jgi:hypothetical protein